MSKSDLKPKPEASEPTAPEPSPTPSPVVTLTQEQLSNMIAASVQAAVQASVPQKGNRDRISIEEAIGFRPIVKVKRTAELDADPNLLWNGQGYQVTPEARLKHVREARASRRALNDPLELARLAAVQAAKALNLQ